MRVAYFPDSFHEINGVAHTSRQYEAYAKRHDLPFLCVRAGPREESLNKNGSLWTLELKRSRASVALDKDLRFDTIFWRHVRITARALREFKPDVVHITGPSDVGILGAWLAWRQGIPLAAGWHTNVHEYAGRRAGWLLRMLPKDRRPAAAMNMENAALDVTQRFYRLARVIFAPNRELVEMLEKSTGRPCHLMQRGMDTELFSPDRRSRKAGDGRFVLGYVGRLSVEKNILYLEQLQKDLAARRLSARVRFLIVGQGSEEQRLRETLIGAEFSGVLRGEQLAEAYANMDAFVFPSRTDTFGNVVLEALASGVPAVVTPQGGPKYLVEESVTGYVRDEDGFAGAIAELMADPIKHAAMRTAARAVARSRSWDAVFASVYAGYADAMAGK